MNKRELIRIVHDKTLIRFEDINVIVDTLIEELKNSVATEGKVVITGLGTFEKYVQAGHEGVNPSTHEKIFIDEISKIKFTPSANFREIINKK